MAEKLNLNRFKSSGVYTVEIDESQNLNLPISTGRIVIGSSKKGPINSVVLLPDTRTENAVYGDIDTKLEKNGSYFHRTLEVALRQGPVFALNVLPVQDSDLAYFRTFNSEPASNNNLWASNINKSAMSSFYNTQKLWFADVDQVSKTKNIALGDDYILVPNQYGQVAAANKILSLVNLSRQDITIWVRVADVSGYDITVKEYYRLLGEKVEIPEYLNPDDVVQDYFVEIIVVLGNWTDNLKLASDPVYKQYFTTTGIIDSKISDFVSLKEVTVMARTQGCIIPDFRDLTGSIVAIDTVFNRKFPQTGVFVALDHKKVDMIDLANTTFDSGSSAEPMEEQRLDLVGYGVDDLDLAVYGVDDGITGTDPVGLIDLLGYRKPEASTFYFTLNTYSPTFAARETYIDGSTPKNIIATENSKLYKAWANGFIKSGDLLYCTATPTVPLYLGTDGNITTRGSVKYIALSLIHI